jgi:DNA-binding NtrC family response regulator
MLSQDSISVFHLDDSREQLELAKILLERADASIKVNQFQSPSDLLRELTLQQCDCIVASYYINRTNIELLAPKIRQVTEAPIILYTVLEGDAVEKVLASTCLDGFVEKKSDLEHYKELTSRVRGAVEKYRRLHGV